MAPLRLLFLLGSIIAVLGMLFGALLLVLRLVQGPEWAVSATAVAVWGGAVGCIGLILRKRWAKLLLLISLAGVVVQDIALFGMTEAASQGGLAVIGLQGLVLVIAAALVLLARHADSRGWLS